MATSGKLTARRGRTSYFMAIIGVSLVLVLLGFLGWMGINYSKLVDHFREKVPVQVFLRETTTDAEKDALMAQVQAMPYIKNHIYKDKETARREWESMGEKDFMNLIDTNVLPRSIEMNLKSEFLVPDTLKKIEGLLLANTNVTDVKYPTNVVGSMTILRKVSFALLGVALLLAIVVIVLIDNTIRLAMFSNRFIIKTMQMVGATRWFIAKPMNLRAIINGTISGVISIVVIWAMLLSFQQIVPELKTLHDTKLFVLLCVLLLLTGVAISLISTHRSVIKYLKMKLDDLY